MIWKKIIIMCSVDLVLHHSPRKNWEGKKCEDMHVCLNLAFLNLKFVLETKDNCVGSQIILSPILSIPKTNYTRILVFMWETLFPWREKPRGKLWINSLLSSQLQLITIILVYVSQLKKNIFWFSLLSHTLINSIKGGNTLLFPFYFLLHTQLSLGSLLFL